MLIIQNKTQQDLKIYIPKEHQRSILRWDTTYVFSLKPASEKKYYHGLGSWSRDEAENIKKAFSEYCLFFVHDTIPYKKSISSEQKKYGRSNLIIVIE
jgi:hypothetical protein